MKLHLKKFGRKIEEKNTLINVEDDPAPTVMADGIGGVGHGQYWLGSEQGPKPRPSDKPPYRVPSMAEVAAVQPNGLTLVSTFSGCGGSCLGFRMAGFRTLWASEFIESARACYRANAEPGTILDDRDIRSVDPAEILSAIGRKQGEVDVLEGSPPCASFSTAGSRSKAWGLVRPYSETKQRTDDLFFEYVRVLRGLMPRVFVAENVSGLIKGVAKGYFLEVLSEMKKCGYKVECRLLDAQWLGVPQKRQRTIFVGVRDDLGLSPTFPKPLPYRYTIRDAIPWIASAKAFSHGPNSWPNQTLSENDPAPSVTTDPQGASWYHHEVEVVGRTAHAFKQARRGVDEPMLTVQATDDHTRYEVVGATEKRKFTIEELRRICSFPDDFVLSGSYAQQWERLGRSVPPLMMRAIAERIRDDVLMRCAA